MNKASKCKRILPFDVFTYKWSCCHNLKILERVNGSTTKLGYSFLPKPSKIPSDCWNKNVFACLLQVCLHISYNLCILLSLDGISEAMPKAAFTLGRNWAQFFVCFIVS